MGAVLAKFRKKKTTYEILEKLEGDIKEIEEYSVNTQAAQRRYVGNFLLISIGLYVISFLVFYFLYFPPTWTERISYFVPLLIFPFLIIFLKRVVNWFFQRKLNKNSKKLNELRAEKKKVLEQVMNTETYKVALEILNRFADKSNGLRPTGAITPRITPSSPMSLKTPTPAPVNSDILSLTQNLKSGLTPFPTSNKLSATPTNAVAMSQCLITGTTTPITSRKDNLQIQRRRTPFPIINEKDKSVFEKLVDYLVGDGVQNRFAMICKECFAHNGMALQEEYEYAAFRCAFCNAMNPSRKSRPIGPKLPSLQVRNNSPQRQLEIKEIVQQELARSDSSSSTSSTSVSEKISGAETDEDEKPPVQDILEEKPIKEVSAKPPDDKKND